MGIAILLWNSCQMLCRYNDIGPVTLLILRVCYWSQAQGITLYKNTNLKSKALLYADELVYISTIAMDDNGNAIGHCACVVVFWYWLNFSRHTVAS